MKTLHIASILAFSALCAFACSDDDDTSPSMPGAAGEAAGGSDGPTAGKSNGGSKANGGDNGVAGGDVGGAAGQGGAAPVDCHEDAVEDANDVGGAGGADGAAGAGGAASVSASLEIIGTWKESFGGELLITSTHWNDGVIHAYDNDANVVYTQTPCSAMYSPGAYSKYVYTEPTGDSFYYCTVVYDAKTLAEAQASTKTADEGDLDTGCNGFPWSEVTKP